MPVETVGHELVKDGPWLDKSWREQFVEFFGIDAQVANARGHGATFYARDSVEELGWVAANGVHDLTDVVKRYAARTAAVVNAGGEFVLQDVLHGTAKVRTRKRVAEFIGEQGCWATGAEPVCNPVDGTGASAGRVVHWERHAENYRVWLDGGNRIFGFGLVLAVIVDGVFRVGFDVWAVWLCLLVSAKDHVSRNADERCFVACGERGCINALTVIQKSAARGVAFTGFQRAVSAGVDDCAKVKTLEKLAQAFRFFGIYAEDVLSKNARVLDGSNPDNAGYIPANGHVAVQFIEMPKKRKAGNAVQPEN